MTIVAYDNAHLSDLTTDSSTAWVRTLSLTLLFKIAFILIQSLVVRSTINSFVMSAIYLQE